MGLAVDQRVRRGELGAFLRSRRARITPEQVGLPLGGRRRTPGLRREEVAQLAGVGVTWYTWLEQGRDINASGQVLAALSRTLRLGPHEHAHLFALAGAPEPPPDRQCKAITPSMRMMMTKLDPYPVVVRNARCDLLGYNRGYAWLMGDVDAIPSEDRNLLVQCLLNPAWRARTLGWDTHVPQVVAGFRAAMADHVAEPSWMALVDRLIARSPLFERLWTRHDVTAEPVREKRYQHPEAGLLTFTVAHLHAGNRSEITVSTYTPADPQTAANLPSSPT
jgi:transcriptional regulator with XRE-family HTH domain